MTRWRARHWRLARPRGRFVRWLALQALKVRTALDTWHFELLECLEELGGYHAAQRFAMEPTPCYVRLANATFQPSGHVPLP